MDRLVELFLQSARIGAAEKGQQAEDGGRLKPEAIEHGVAAVEKMLSSEDAIRMGGAPAATFVCLAMALEEKPHLHLGAIRCYEKSLEIIDRKSKRLKQPTGSWERAVVLQQLGVVCLRQSLIREGERWLVECVQECAKTDGHPRDVVLFGGAFNTPQTRVEFVATVEKVLSKLYEQLGDQEKSRAHWQNVERLSRLSSSDAVERAVARGETAGQNAKSGKEQSRSSSGTGTGVAQTAAGSTPRALWASSPAEERNLKEYRYVDEGPTVSVLLELNEHLGIGEEGSAVVQSLQQFRVHCNSDSVDIKLRLERKDSEVWEFCLHLAPLVYEIIPEDTVPRLRGREGKRRLEVKLFKKDKKITWRGDLVSSKAPAVKSTPATAKASAAESKGTALNPLSAEELASLPRPSGGTGDNRPSAWQAGPVLLERKDEPVPKVCEVTDEEAAEILAKKSVAMQEEAVSAKPHPVVKEPKASPSATISKAQPPANDKEAPATAAKNADVGGSADNSPLPSWVSQVEEHETGDGVDLLVQIAEAAGAISMQDLELEGDASSGFRVRFCREEAAVLELPQPAGVDMSAAQARWRRKTRTLELKLPRV